MASKRALIVDDSTTAQYRLKKMLRVYPLDIDIVDSGEAALRYLAHHSPDVIFMDHLMPGMDGFRALQIIKSHPETAMIPVIMYTSKSGDVYTGQARALGALDVVSKDSINATDLSRVMETIHIYPLPKSHPQNSSNDVESAELIAAANKVSNASSAQLERRAPNQAAMEQARNIELRLSHMEHSLEDNRRFITSRVSRELQGLRQTLRQELGEILQQQPAATAVEPLERPAAENNNRWGLGLLLLAGIIAAVYFFLQINNQLKHSQQQQDLLAEQLQDLIHAAHIQQPQSIHAIAQPVALTPSTAVSGTGAYESINYLEDLDVQPTRRPRLSPIHHRYRYCTALARVASPPCQPWFQRYCRNYYLCGGFLYRQR